MTTSEALEPRREISPFELKREGAFSRALLGYASSYLSSLERGATPIAELSFEQMFDIALLMLLKEQRQFRDRRELMAAVKQTLCDTLEDMDCRSMDTFHSYFRKCEKNLFKTATPFSVDAALLIEKGGDAQSGEQKGRGQPLVVDGTTYSTAAEAYRAVIGEPRTQMNRHSIKQALARDGHRVSD